MEAAGPRAACHPAPLRGLPRTGCKNWLPAGFRIRRHCKKRRPDLQLRLPPTSLPGIVRHSRPREPQPRMRSRVRMPQLRARNLTASVRSPRSCRGRRGRSDRHRQGHGRRRTDRGGKKRPCRVTRIKGMQNGMLGGKRFLHFHDSASRGIRKRGHHLPVAIRPHRTASQTSLRPQSV